MGTSFELNPVFNETKKEKRTYVVGKKKVYKKERKLNRTEKKLMEMSIDNLRRRLENEVHLANRAVIERCTFDSLYDKRVKDCLTTYNILIEKQEEELLSILPIDEAFKNLRRKKGDKRFKGGVK